MDRGKLETMKVAELRNTAETLGITRTSKMKKTELIDLILETDKQQKAEKSAKKASQKAEPARDDEKQGETAEKNQAQRRAAFSRGELRHSQSHNTPTANTNHSPNSVESNSNHQSQNAQSNTRYARIKDNIEDSVNFSGPLEVQPEGYGFIKRNPEDDSDWVYVSGSQVQKFRLSTGDIVGGKVRKAKAGEKYDAMLFLEEVNGTPTSEIISRMNSMMYGDMKKDMDRYNKSQEGILDIHPDGYGFLRTNHYLPGDNDIYIAGNQIRRYSLRDGDKIRGRIRMSGEEEKYDALLYVESVNGELPERVKNRPRFERLTPIFPDVRITLETDRDTMATRLIDLFAPIGKGQRGMIVAPPKAGKTTLLKAIASGITANHPDIELIIFLVDERPEEVTDIKRSITEADIVYSTFDQPPENHIRAAQMVLERGKRLVEQKKDVVILVDSLTRLTRANNLVIEPSGRTLSGGIDPESLYFPKKFFGSARNIEGGGSLTILATALVDTGSRMDDIIFEEFKGTGNMELDLERELAERRIFPAMNLNKSGTRREEMLLSPDELKASYTIRKLYGGNSAVQVTDKVINTMEKTVSNEDFVHRLIHKTK